MGMESIQNGVLYSTVRIVAFKNDKPDRRLIGTGFFVADENKQRPALVTNKHVLVDCDTAEIMLCGMLSQGVNR